ncbi:histidinol-phosphatase HisJ family protein [Vallitalea pronyensis]|uniref:Histidinol-phosphatase n=1 Tax=Vallitalea pronyensis TaxID=1348613 RepID=A0A8J8SH07_9FIRM|nr:histidinol-phosphatase HisJ family protein [Vallitalea pronyensis]QUI22873.1 histidinol-phosphatase HisJ family protein [Vallitalea pronyensis]
MKEIYLDYHIHSSMSPDTDVSMEEMCQSAIHKGFKEIAFTDHFEFYTTDKEGRTFNEAYLDTYFETLGQCREKFKNQLIIRRGIELGQQHVQLQRSNTLLSLYAFDYVLASVHKINDVDLSQVVYHDDNIDHYCKRYLEQLYTLVDKGDFDVLAHLDLIKRYAARQHVQVDLIHYKLELAQIFERLIQRGKGLEINTSTLRRGLDEPFPSMAILKMYKGMGGEIITVGSDAHDPEDIGGDFHMILDMLAAVGLKRLYHYDNRKGMRVQL